VKNRLKISLENNLKVIITGSEGLIGKTICNLFEDINYNVIRCDLQLGHDLNDEKFVRNFFKSNTAPYLLNLFGLNNHQTSSDSSNNVFDISLQSFNAYLQCNLVNLFSTCREFARNSESKSIVNVSSLYSIISPDPLLYKTSKNDRQEKHIAYGVSKAGVEQLTRHLGVHLAPKIRVNCVAPGGVESSNIPEDFKIKFCEKVPLKRQQKIEELFGMFRFLCSEESSYTTCEIFRINGGYGCL